MPPRTMPSIRAQLLGKLLREYREAAGVSAHDAWVHIQRDQSTMSRMESGHVPARVPDIRALLELYGIADPTVLERLTQLSHDVTAKGWWDDYADVLKPWFLDFPWLEERSRIIKSYDMTAPPGLLQTQGFAEAVTRATDIGNEELSRRGLKYRMTRQRVLDRKDPPELSVVIEESALTRPIGGPAVMRTQLERMAVLAERPNIEIRVLPHNTGAHPGLSGSFQIFELRDLLSDLAWSDTLAGAMFVESGRVAAYRRAYDGLQTLALPADESLRIILSTAEEMR